MPVWAQQGVVNLYSSRHYQTDEALYAEFTKQTGIRINRIEAGEDALLARIRSEGERSPADVLITASYQASIEGFKRRGLNEAQVRTLFRLSVQLAAEAIAEHLAEERSALSRLPPLIAASIGPYGAYLAETIRAGILSVPRGQGEAAMALGLGRGVIAFKIIAPQAMRIIIPPAGGHFISMLKDSATSRSSIWVASIRRAARSMRQSCRLR